MAELRGEPFGRYELVAEIGRGGMAQLFLARLVGIAGFAKPLAIKRILPHLTEDERFVDMFLNEGRIAAKLSHPNICQVFELGEVDGELFLAMEYLEGVPWGELVASVGPSPDGGAASGSVRDPVAILRLAASVIGQACDGLHYAHELHDSRGRPTPVVHRDISPGNLFVTVDGACKVLDFGVSKIATDQHQTRSGMVKGKLAYMPPEQIKGEHVDARVDVFAMTVVLWEALAGQRLFLRDNDYQIIRAVLDEPIPTLGHLFPPSIGPGVDALLARGLERDRERRYPTIRALADDLRALVAPLGGVPSPPEVGGIVRDTFEPRLAERSRLVAHVTGIYERTDDTSETTTADATQFRGEPSATKSIAFRAGTAFAVKRAPPRRRWWPFVAGGIALLALAAVAVTLLDRSDEARVADAAVAAPRSMSGDAMIDAALALERDVTADADLAASADTALDADTQIATEDIVVEPTPTGPTGLTGPTNPRPRPKKDPAKQDNRHGYYSVDSNPYATIYIDGKRRDQTPLYRIELPPGRHQVRAVLANGRSRTFTIQIAPGKEVTSGTLRW